MHFTRITLMKMSLNDMTKEEISVTFYHRESNQIFVSNKDKRHIILQSDRNAYFG